MNTYKTKSQKAVALLLAFIMLMPTQALAAVSENLKDKKDINAEVRPEIIMDNNSDFSVSKPKFQIKTEPKKSDTKTEIIIPEKVEIEVPNAQEIKSNLIKADTFSTSTMVTQDEKSNYFNITIDSNIDPEDNMIHWYITVENLVDGHISKDDERTLDATFLVNRLSGLSNLRIEKLMDSDGRGVAHTKRTNKDNKIDLDIETMGIKTRVPNKITYYLTADIDSLNSDDIYSLDFSFNLKDSYNSSKRYAINGMGNLVDQNSKSNPIQTYKDSDKTITTDIVLAQTTEDEINDDNTKIVTEDKNKSPKFEYEITEESKANFKDSKVTIEYYNSTDEGYVKEASKELIYVDNLPEKIELDLKEGQVAKIVTESIKKDEIKPELVTPSEAPIIMEETYPRLDNEEQKPSINTELEPSTAPEIIVDETRPEISEESPIIFEENKPAIITEARRETAKRPEIKIEENIFETRKAEKLLAPKTKVVFDKLEGSKEDVKIELETRREELDKKIATLDKESEKAKSAIISSKPEIIIDEAKEVAPKLKLSDSLTSLKSSENIMADIESSEITENDLAAVATDLNITTEDKTAREALAEKLVTGELTEEALKVYLEDIIIRKELSTEEIQLVIDSIGNEYDLNKSELKEILRLVTEKLNNNNEAILEMLKENGLEIDSENPEEKLSQTEIVKLLEENGKSEKEAKEIASSLYEKTGYELNPEKVLRDALANKSLSREELENLIDEIVKEYGIDKSEVERILDKLNLEETSQENLAKDIIELNENKEEINLNLAKSRLLNILKTFALTDEKELEILEKLSGTTKGEVLKSLDEILPTYGFGAEDIDRIKTNIFTEVESYELVESLRAILTPYQVTQEQVEEILNRVFLNPNLTPDELRNRIREILPEYNFGIEDVEKIIIELLGEEISKTASEELRELLASGEITKEKLIEFLTELKDKYNLTEAEIETLLEENKKDLENILDETDLLEDLIGLVGRIQITRFAYEVEYQDGKSTGLQEVELDEIEIEEETEIEKPSLLERILGSDETSKSSEKNNEEEIKTIKKEETQKSSIEVKSPEEIEVERVIRELLTTRPAEEVTFDELSRVLAEELPYIDLAQIDVMNIFFDIVNTKEEVTYEKSADEKLAEILDNPDLDNEIFIKELRELKDAYNLSDDELKSLLENHSDRINEIKGDFTIEEIIAASSYESENTVLAATDFGPKKFHLLTEMNVLASAGWQIPEGYYFDINIGPYLKQGTNNLKSLTDESGKVIAIPSYDEATNIIRYTFPSDLIVTKNLKIDQYLDFNVDKIPADADDVNINISVKPKNGVLQSLPTIKVNKNDQNPSTLIPGGKTPGISTDTSGDSYRKTYPYDIDYWTYQYYDQEKNTINWDIQIETHKVNLEHLNFYNLGLALYAPEAQGLENYKVTIRSYPKDMTVTKRSLVKKQTTPTTGIDFETAGTLTKNGDSNLLTYNKSFEKGGLNNKKLPEDLFIHIEAKPTDNHAKYQMYDLGLRLTPDVNYINDIVQEFKDDWAKLVAMMPWIIPYKDGEAFAEKFADGFNVVDTRLPADAMAAAYYDDKFKATSYTDKSRSVFGEFTSDNQIRWQISDTLRLQDKDRKVQGSNLGNEIFNKSFNANNSTGHTNPNIEVLEPKSDGTYTKIFSTTAPTNPSGAEDFRNKLSNVRPVLLPGTIINYTFKDRTATNPSEDSTVTINFSDRVDDEVGTYGGSQTATLRKLSPKEIEDNEKYRVVYAEYKSGDIKNEKNRIDAMIIKSTGDIVYCLNATLSSPAAKGIADNVRYSKKYEDISGAKLNELISRKTSSQEALIRRLKAIFYTAEYEYNFNSIYISANEWGPDKTKYNAVQAAIYRAIDDYNNGIGLNTAEEKSYYRGFANGDPNKVFEGGIKPTVDSFYNKVKEVEGRLGGDLDNLVRLDGYESIMDSSKKAQNVLGPVFTSPFEIDKVDKDDNKLSGIEFNIVDSNGAIVKKWTSSEKTEKIYLKPGVYTLKEVDSKTYKAIKDVKFEIKEEKVQVNKYDYIDFSNKQSGQVTNYKNQLKLALLENDNKDSSFGQLVTLDNDAIKIKVKNIGDTKLEVSKKLLGADGKYHELAGIKFTLEGNGIFNWTKKEATTNKDGIAVFDNLPLNSQWTLKEIVPKDIVVDHGVTWNVKVDRSGNVTVVPSQIDDSISSFKDGVLTVINEPDIKEPGNFKIKKVDSETKQPIKEVEFSLYGSDKKTQIGETTKTNENGEIYYRNLPNGIYYLKENIPQGYKAISEWTTIIVNNGQTSVVNVDITVGANGDMISLEPKYSLTIVNEIGNAIDINITDGTINANNLNNGTYTIKDGDKEVLTIEVKNKKIVNLTDPNKPLNNSEDDNSTDDNPVKEPTEDPKPIEPQYPKYIEVSNNENSVIVQFPDYTSKSVRIFQGKVDISSWNTGTYTIEDDGYGNRLVASVKDGQVVNLQKYRLQTPVPINGKTLYVKHDDYPSYMNFKEYSEVTNTNTGEITTYIMLKPDANNGGNGTDRNTIYNIYSSNSTIKKAELFRVGTGSTKSTVSNAMTNQNMRSYMNTTYVAKPDTQEYSQNNPISINEIKNNTVDLNTTSVRVTLPKERFANDWSFVLKITSNIDNKLEPAFFNYMWNSEASGEASITGDRDIPALQKYVKVSKLDNVIFANLLNTVKTSYNTLSEFITPTVYAAEEDVTKLDPSLVNNDNFYNTTKEKTVIEKINNGLELIQDTPISNVLNLTFNVAEVLSPQSTSITKSYFNSVLNIEVEEGVALPSISDIKISNDKTEFNDIDFDNVVEYEIENIPDKPGEGEIIVNKKDDSNNPLDGVEFTLYDFDWTKVASTSDRPNPQTTKEGGRVKWSNLPYGKYWLVETKSADGYIRNPEPRLVTISYEYNAPETAGKDVSNQLTLNRSSDPLPNISSSSGSESEVYPNNAEGLKVNLNYSVNRNSDIKPGDYFYLSVSDNIDFDGIFNVDTVVKAGGHDIIGSQGTVAKASVKTTDDGKKYLKYTFTDYVKERKLEDINMTLPLFINRIKVQNNGYQNMSIGIGSPTNRREIFSDSIYVNYTDFYDKHPSANIVNSFPTKVDPATGYFRTIVYANQMNEYSWNKRITFSSNQDLTGLTYKVYVQNGDLPPSYGITSPGTLINTDEKDTLNKGDEQTINLGPNNEYNSNTYYVVIEGKLDNKSFTEFKSRVIYESYIDNYYSSTYFYWDNEVKNYQPTYNSDGNLVYQMPVEVTVLNSKNEVEYTKIEALEGSVENNDTTSTSEVDTSVTKNKDNSITAINGAKFELRKLDEATGKYKKVEGSDQESKDGGKLKWTKLAPGKYEVWETEALEGYNLPTEAVAKFNVNEDGLVSKVDNEDKVISQPYIENSKISKGKLRLLKVDSENKPLEGVEFSLTGPNEYNETVKSDATGEIRFTNLKPGTYTLKETSTVAGYIKTNQEWSVVVDNSGKTTITPITKVGSADTSVDLDIENLDEDAKKKLKLNGFLIANVEPSADATEGDVNNISTIKVVNHKAEYPYTGGLGENGMFLVVGALVMAAGAIFYGKKRRFNIYGN